MFLYVDPSLFDTLRDPPILVTMWQEKLFFSPSFCTLQYPLMIFSWQWVKMAEDIQAKLEKYRTAPFDARFPNQNQTRNCWSNYLGKTAWQGQSRELWFGTFLAFPDEDKIQPIKTMKTMLGHLHIKIQYNTMFVCVQFVYYTFWLMMY